MLVLIASHCQVQELPAVPKEPLLGPTLGFTLEDYHITIQYTGKVKTLD